MKKHLVRALVWGAARLAPVHEHLSTVVKLEAAQRASEAGARDIRESAAAASRKVTIAMAQADDMIMLAKDRAAALKATVRESTPVITPEAASQLVAAQTAASAPRG